MSEKQKQKRNEYILINKVQEDFEGICEEMKEYYAGIVLENEQG
jgi:hypothetical protein